MVTTTFTVKPYLARYMYARYGKCVEEFAFGSSLPAPIRLSPRSVVYHALHWYATPYNGGGLRKEEGNITFVLPNPEDGKNPQMYNYIGDQAAHLIGEIIETQMRMELFEYLLAMKNKYGMMFKKTLRDFIDMYGMEELVTEESLLRAFQRWRERIKTENRRWRKENH